MNDRLGFSGDGQTPLNDEDFEGLIPSYVSTRGELDEIEQANIVRARVARRVPALDALLDDKYQRDLHKAMFRDVWKWAGQYRTREMYPFTIDPALVATEMRDLVENARFWIAGPIDEAAARFHHRLTQIHAFRNGNGRHARESTDLLLAARATPTFTWGARLRVDKKELRARYVTALRAADGGDLAPLLAFVRT